MSRLTEESRREIYNDLHSCYLDEAVDCFLHGSMMYDLSDEQLERIHGLFTELHETIDSFAVGMSVSD